MNGFIARTLITALGLGFAAWILPGIVVSGAGTLILAALLMGVVNAVVRPIVILLTLPLTIISLGLFLFVVNAAMFGLVAAFLPGFSVSGFFSALFGWLLVSIVAGVSSWFIGPKGDVDVFVVASK